VLLFKHIVANILSHKSLLFRPAVGEPGSLLNTALIFRTSLILCFFVCFVEALSAFDTWLFYRINTSAINPVFDVLMPILTSSTAMLPLYIAGFCYALWRNRRSGIVLIVLALVSIVLIDQSIIYIKAYFGRMRPCQSLSGVRLLIECGTGQSMPSAHAANNAGLAVVVGWVYGRKALITLIALSWAFLVAYSRVYCGVHYPFDILAGILWGSFIAFLVCCVAASVVHRSKSVTTS
jgi:undecaprenyl-diphosphatase